VLLGVRIAKEVLAHIDHLAEQEKLMRDGKPDRARMTRLLLSYAIRTWRMGWRP
jgi:hypothetical protein